MPEKSTLSTLRGAELVDPLQERDGRHNRFQFPHLLRAMEANQFGRDRPLYLPDRGGHEPKTQRQTPNDTRPLADTVRHATDLPERTAPEVIILLAIGVEHLEPAPFGRAKAAMMEKISLAERLSLPALHPSRRHRDPVDATRLVGNVSAHVLKARPPKQLAAAGHV